MDDNEIRVRLLSGASHRAIAEDAGISTYQVRKAWKKIVQQLSDPAEVKRLANGPMLNPNEIVRWSGKAARKKVVEWFQQELFDG